MANPVSHFTIVHNSKEGVATVDALLTEPAAKSQEAAQSLINYLTGLVSGGRSGQVTYRLENATTVVQATATITITHANVDDGDDVSIGDVVFEAQDAAPAGNQWLIGADATADATALAAAINASAELKGLVVATTAAGVVTLTYYLPGRDGNLVKLETDDATAFALSATSLGTGASTQTAAPRTWDYGGL